MRYRVGENKGQVIVGFAAAAVFLLAMIGLAIDIGMAYLVKTKLSAAVDAAALAAVKMASQGESVVGKEAAKFFSINYPDGMLGAAVAAPATVLFYDNKEKSYTVTVSTTAVVPAYFAKVVGRNEFTVGAKATTTVTPVDLVLVLDTSATMRNPNVGVLEALKVAARKFLDNFNPNFDRIGLIRFASGVSEDFKITGKRGFDKEKMQQLLSSTDVVASGFTTAEEALRRAKDQLDSIPEHDRSRRRIIVFFADGAPNGIAARYESEKGPTDGVVSSQTRPTPNHPTWDYHHLYKIDKVNSDLLSPDLASSLVTLPETDWTGTVPLKSFNGIRRLLAVADGDDVGQICNVNRAARNMAENVANAARSEASPISVFAIWRGAKLDKPEIEVCGYGSSENGQNIMRRLANVPGVDTYNPNQPKGIYVSAEPEEFEAAFRHVAESVIRLSR